MLCGAMETAVKLEPEESPAESSAETNAAALETLFEPVASSILRYGPNLAPARGWLEHGTGKLQMAWIGGSGNGESSTMI